jgi:transcription elongation factor Elf1
MKVGVWTVKATFSSDKSATGEITITPGILETIQVTPSNITINIDQTQTFTAVGYDLFDNIVNFKPTWETNGGGTVEGTGSTCEFTSIQPGGWEVYAKYTLPDDSVVTGTAKVYIQPIKDADGDGMPDDWELDHGLNPDNPNDAEDDSDYDYLTNLEEYLADTDPTNPDSDGDELPDGWEVANGLDPQDTSGNYGKYGDLDGDGFSNLQEYNARTDPDNADSNPISAKSDDESNGLESYLLFLIIIIIAVIILAGLIIAKKRGLPGEPVQVEPEEYQDSVNCPKCNSAIKLQRSDEPTLHLTCKSCGARGHLPNPNVQESSLDDYYVEPEEPESGIDWDDEPVDDDDDYYEVDEYEDYDEDDAGEIDWD